MKRMSSLCLRRASNTPLIPSPGRPKMVFTPLSISLSTSTSEAFMQTTPSPQRDLRTLDTPLEARLQERGLLARRPSKDGGIETHCESHSAFSEKKREGTTGSPVFWRRIYGKLAILPRHPIADCGWMGRDFLESNTPSSSQVQARQAFVEPHTGRMRWQVVRFGPVS